MNECAGKIDFDLEEARRFIRRPLQTRSEIPKPPQGFNFDELIASIKKSNAQVKPKFDELMVSIEMEKRRMKDGF